MSVNKEEQKTSTLMLLNGSRKIILQPLRVMEKLALGVKELNFDPVKKSL